MKELIVAQVESAHIVVATFAGSLFDSKLVVVIVVGLVGEHQQRCLLCNVSLGRVVVHYLLDFEVRFFSACYYN